jgi:hypothetical protein
VPGIEASMRSIRLASSLAALLLLAGCDAGADDHDHDDTAPDAATSEPVADASPMTTDAAASAPDAAPDTPGEPLCAEPGAEGNSKGVGRYCTPGGGECQGTDAPFCTVDFESDADPFCTTFCISDSSCGEDASCQSQGGQSGCVPDCIL